MDDAGWMLLASFANLVFRPPGDRNDVTDEQGDDGFTGSENWFDLPVPKEPERGLSRQFDVFQSTLQGVPIKIQRAILNVRITIKSWEVDNGNFKIIVLPIEN